MISGALLRSNTLHCLSLAEDQGSKCIITLRESLMRTAREGKYFGLFDFLSTKRSDVLHSGLSIFPIRMDAISRRSLPIGENIEFRHVGS